MTVLGLRIRAALSRLSGNAVTFSGDYQSWDEARRNSSGYERMDILEKVAVAAGKAARGEVAYERDSATFARPAAPFPVLAALLRAALENGGSLSVLDFGGSLGSTYFQCRPFLPDCVDLRWSIVEQEHFVQRGRKDLESRSLRFFATTKEAVAHSRPDVVLASSVLQYLERPQQALRELADCGSRYLVVDRTPLSDSASDRLTVQRVPASIYAASYPCRIFSRDRLGVELAAHWQLLAQFASDDGWAVAGGLCFRFEGMLMGRKT